MEGNIIFRLFGLILTAYIFLSIAAICKLYKLHRTKLEAARRITPSDNDLWRYLLQSQKELNVSKLYQLDEEKDRTVVKKIIELYQADLSKDYFRDRFHPQKTKSEQSDIVYFMLSFYEYLRKAYYASYDGYMHLNISDIYHNIYNLQELIERDEEDGKIPYSTRTKMEIIDYQISRQKIFEALYCKVHYIAYRYCCNCHIINPSLSEHWDESIKRFLEFELSKRTS